MKKRLFLAVTSLSLLTIAACGETATPTSDTKDASDLTLQQVFDKALERQQNLKSVHVDVEMDQMTEMTIEGQPVNMTSSTNMAMDVSQNPIGMYTKGAVVVDMGQEQMTMPLEMYMTEQDGFFMYNDETAQWMKLPAEQLDQMLQQTGAQADASEQLQQLKPFIDDFKFEQDNETYKLTLNVEGEKFKEFILSQMGTSVGEATELGGDLVSGMSFEDSSYEIVIVKDTFDTKEIDMDITILMEIEGQKTKIENDARMDYSNFDKVAPIKVPEEVKNKAISN